MRFHPSPLTLLPAALCLLAASGQAAVTVTVHPAARQLQGAGTCTLTWTVIDSDDPRLTFQVLEPDGGTVDAEGRYTAPPVVLAERSVHVRGTSVADGKAHADAEILLVPNRVEVALPGIGAPGDVADLMARLELFGPDWAGGHSEQLPFLDLASGERFGEGKAEVRPWTLDAATVKARNPWVPYPGARPTLDFHCAYGLPCTFAWTPMPQAESQMLSLRMGTEITRLDVTGARSRSLRITDRVSGGILEALRAGKDPGSWVSDVQEVHIYPRGVLPLAGSLHGNPGHEDGDGPAARFQAPAGLVWLSEVRKAAVADPEAHCISLVDRDGRVRRLCGLPTEPGDRDGTLAVARFRSPAHLAVGPDPAGDRGGVLGPNCLYVSDSAAHVIRRIRSDDTVETYAGVPGQAGFRDAEDPSQALFNQPQGIALHPTGVLAVADQGNHRVRLITPEGAGDGPRVRTLAGSGAVGVEDGAPLAATFTELRDLCWAWLPAERDLVLVTDGNAVRAIRMEPTGVETWWGSVAKAGFQDSVLEEGKEPPSLRNVPCLNHPTAIIQLGMGGNLMILDAGNRALRYFRLYPGSLSTVTGPSADPEFGYGLLNANLPGPLPPGFGFARLGTPRGLCYPAGFDENPTGDFILSTEHRLVWVGRPLDEYPRGQKASLRIEAPAAQAERKETAPEAVEGPVPLGPCPVRFRIEPQVRTSGRVFYAAQWIDPDGSVAAVVQGGCVAGEEKAVTGRFRATGRAKVVLTWVREEGLVGAQSLEVRVE